MITFTTMLDMEMAVWAAYGGRVVLKGGRVAILQHWPPQSARCLIGFRSGSHLRVRKSEVDRCHGFITIGDRTYIRRAALAE